MSYQVWSEVEILPESSDSLMGTHGRGCILQNDLCSEIWSWSYSTLVTRCKEPTHYKRPWSWESLKAERERDNRGQYCLMASSTQWTWGWASSRTWWKTGKPGMLQFMGSQRVKHSWVDWTTRYAATMGVYLRTQGKRVRTSKVFLEEVTCDLLFPNV